METKSNILQNINEEEIGGYFQNILEINEYKRLEKFIHNNNWIISWTELRKEWEVVIENNIIKWIYWKNSLFLPGIDIESLRKIKRIDWYLDLKWRKLKNLWELEEVKGFVDLTSTSIKSLNKLKKSGHLNCNFMESLEDLWDLELVNGELDLNRTSIQTLWKLKIVKWHLYCRDIKTLKDLWDLETVEGNFYVKNISVKLQLEIMDKYKKWKLKVKWLISFGWEMDWIEKFLEREEILGNLDLSKSGQQSLWKIRKVKGILDCSNMELKDLWVLEKVGALNIRWNSLFLQIYVLYQRKKWKIKIDNLFIDGILEEFFDKIYQEGYFDIEIFRSIFGEDISKIEEDGLKNIAKEILLVEYKWTTEFVKEKIKRIIVENQEKNLTEQQKKSIKREIIKLDKKLEYTKTMLEKFWIYIV